MKPKTLIMVSDHKPASFWDWMKGDDIVLIGW